MGKQRGRRLITTALAALIALGGAGTGHAPAEARDVVAVVTQGSTFLPGDDDHPAPTLYVPAGTGMTMTNLDAFAAHGIRSDDSDAAGEAIFDSGVQNFRTAPAPVRGVAALVPGTYGFHCLVHLDNMHGTLVIV